MNKVANFGKNIFFILPLRIFLFLISTVGFYFPINNNIWVFGAWVGKSYNDNSKYFFEYVYKNKKNKIRPIWLTKNENVLKSLREENKEAYLFYSPKGIYFSLISGVLIVSASWIDLPFVAFIARRKKIIQLWHGTPLRKMNIKSGSFFKKLSRFIFITYLGREYDLVFTAADKNVEIDSLKNRFNIETERIKVAGQPRTDVFFQKNNYKSLIKIKKESKVFLYMPTWRNYKYNLLDDSGFNFDKINNFLESNNAYLIIKVHQNEFKKYESFPEGVGGRVSVTFNEDIYPYLPTIDFLLTDYSSVFFDFTILNKPIIFLPFDMKKYMKDNGGFYYNYNNTTPGPKLKNWNEVISYMEKVGFNKDEYREKRQKIRGIFNKYADGKNSERVFDEIIKAL